MHKLFSVVLVKPFKLVSRRKVFRSFGQTFFQKVFRSLAQPFLKVVCMKQVTIKGKNNIYKCLKANLDENAEKCRVREGMADLNEVDTIIQFDMIRKLYLDMPFEYKELLHKELEKKINGYKGQDIKKEIYDLSKLITLEEVVEKLVASKLKCFYCSSNVLILYKNVRESTQWTLDRKDNDLCHSCDNTIIACLKCNLQRRVTNMDKFDFTKKLLLKKVDV